MFTDLKKKIQQHLFLGINFCVKVHVIVLRKLTLAGETPTWPVPDTRFTTPWGLLEWRLASDSGITRCRQ